MHPVHPHRQSGSDRDRLPAGIGVLVLAAGKSTRIAAVSGGLPKPLLRIAGKSVLAHNLEWLASEGVESVWMNLHYRPDDIRSEVEASAPGGLTVQYAHEEVIMGTAGGWKRLLPMLHGNSLVIYGDNLMRFDLGRLYGHHVESNAAATIALFHPEVHANTGIAGGRVTLSATGRVASFVEGGGGAVANSGYVNAGAYVVNESVAAEIGEGLQDFGRDVLPPLAHAGWLAGHVIEAGGYCLGIDTPESLDIAHHLIRTSAVELP